jgi:hypothetical protein
MNKRLIIRAQNDTYRRRLIGGGGVAGQTVMTAGIAALPADRLARIFRAVASFSAFDNDNDPHHEHDFGSVEDDGDRIFWKFDYYADASMEHGAEDATNSYRVLTIMFAAEY